MTMTMTMTRHHDRGRGGLVLVAALGWAACAGRSGENGDSGDAGSETSASGASGGDDASSGDEGSATEASGGDDETTGESGGETTGESSGETTGESSGDCDEASWEHNRRRGAAECWNAASEEACKAWSAAGQESDCYLPAGWFCFWTEVRRHAALECGEPESTESMCFGVYPTGSQGCDGTPLCGDDPQDPMRHIRELDDGGWESFDHDYCSLSNRIVDSEGNDWLGWAPCYWNGPNPEDLAGESPELCACECPPP